MNPAWITQIALNPGDSGGCGESFVKHFTNQGRNPARGANFLSTQFRLTAYKTQFRLTAYNKYSPNAASKP
ncbi:hypothetical protein Pan181_51200 [Aeoliella mucimassa]|uniref:Uncharacterized protein n=1 Tax=Aeoliella mucimassa TaxID=2527972 RepID=A0A518AVY7_9BACT|nr:hypothetical protein Pan181_51200 [Aeoliella mucimassa]